MSLKDLLIQKIKEKGFMTYGEVCQIAAEEGYKVDTATRRLRELESIEPVMATSRRGTKYISGYKWAGEVPMVKVSGDMFSGLVYKVHDPVTRFSDPA